VRGPQGCRASGAVRFLTPTRALIQLSFRYLSDDHFWFTFFHEAGHILLHEKGRLFVEGVATNTPREESEANQFAVDTLIPQELRKEFSNLRAHTFEVIRFASKAGISPGIVVGQLQHLQIIPPNRLNRLKRRFSWENEND
jgi:Zn-dependent peptidase ImmA (M78 family)